MEPGPYDIREGNFSLDVGDRYEGEVIEERQPARESRHRSSAWIALLSSTLNRRQERSGFTEKKLLEKADRIHGRGIDLMLYAVERP